MNNRVEIGIFKEKFFKIGFLNDLHIFFST
jgi:hypothetical protein